MRVAAERIGWDGVKTTAISEEMKEAYAPFDRIVEPQPEMRADVAALIEATRGVCELYVLVNNKVEGSSPLTVRGLVEELSASLSASTRTPPPSTR